MDWVFIHFPSLSLLTVFLVLSFELIVSCEKCEFSVGMVGNAVYLKRHQMLTKEQQVQRCICSNHLCSPTVFCLVLLSIFRCINYIL